MRGFIVAYTLGVASATVGFSGLAPILDSAVKGIQQTTINTVQKSQQSQIQNYDLQHSSSYQRTQSGVETTGF